MITSHSRNSSRIAIRRWNIIWHIWIDLRADSVPSFYPFLLIIILRALIYILRPKDHKTENHVARMERAREMMMCRAMDDCALGFRWWCRTRNYSCLTKRGQNDRYAKLRNNEKAGLRLRNNKKPLYLFMAITEWKRAAVFCFPSDGEWWVISNKSAVGSCRCNFLPHVTSYEIEFHSDFTPSQLSTHAWSITRAC